MNKRKIYKLLAKTPQCKSVITGVIQATILTMLGLDKLYIWRTRLCFHLFFISPLEDRSDPQCWKSRKLRV